MAPISIRRQSELLEDLARLVEQRASDETRFESDFADRKERALGDFQTAHQRATATFKDDTAELNTEYTSSLDEVIRQFEEVRDEVADKFETAQLRVSERHDRSLKEARGERRLISAKAEDQYQRDIVGPKQQSAAAGEQSQQRQAELQQLQTHAQRVLKSRRCGALVAWEPGDVPSELPSYAESLAEARRQLQQLKSQKAAKFVEEGWPVLLFIGAALALIWPSIHFLDWGWTWVAAVFVGAAAITALVSAVIYPLVRRQAAAVYPGFREAVWRAHLRQEKDLAQAVAAAKQRHQEITQQRDDSVLAADRTWSEASQRIAASRDVELKQIEENVAEEKANATRERDERLQRLNEKYPRLISQREEAHQTEIADLEATRDAELAANQAEYDERWAKLIAQWSQGMEAFQVELAEMNAYCDDRFPPWEAIDFSDWQPPAEVVDALRFGNSHFDMTSWPHGVSRDERLQVEQTRFELPAVITFPECPSLLLESQDEGRDVAVQTLQDVMLRMLTSLPPGKVRFTIIDPTGLGQNFSAFMHLADYDDQLVTNRIWTETAHINQRLLDLTEHMEKVIQKYLRNEFESIQQYNQHAGEVAEPFQILVIANFPANFSEEAARRLVSIASSGARCGVYTLISTDNKLNLPRNFDLGDLEARAATLRWDEARFRWTEPRLAPLPVALESPPDDEQFSQAVKEAGRHAKDSNRVEVPFSSVAPAGELWTMDSRRELEVALGKAGATKLQSLRLGKGTSQHVLISGKTGSGKSTLLHAMITNLALHYSPNEVQFYLIDFKKGVEFRPYAALKLPHARVIAIESEREFGMSVLERLDGELKERGDLFRADGVQSLAAYRDNNPESFMPRILLIIDEFQELFVKDDKLAQEASLLLDRLVRQGRAFGIHVLLGSQTLAGAYSLARSTIGQMAVRIALQCSETDAHLILSEDNTAARLLSRPGEAIYNDANGLMEGNHPFQVVWLTDSQRESYLEQLKDRAAQNGNQRPPPIVFEGNVAADLSQNSQLRTMLSEPAVATASPRIFLGAAVAIKDPTSGVFRRQSGSNLLVVGQHPGMATGVLASSLLSLAAQVPAGSGQPTMPNFTILDGTRGDEEAYWRRFVQRTRIDAGLGGPRDAGSIIQEFAAEVERRTAEGSESAAPLFLCIYNLSRFRDLKKSDDDFGFSSFSDDAPAASPGKQLVSILREGPPVGIHTLLWSDTFNNTTRWLDRQTLRDLEMRVLFQMSSTDSSNLMDSPEACRLGMHRGILYSEELGEFEKFRPYGAPEAEFLDWVESQISAQTQH